MEQDNQKYLKIKQRQPILEGSIEDTDYYIGSKKK